MAQQVSEYWTLSRECLVLRGSPVELCRVARDLEISEHEVVCVSATRATLGLWGKPLEKYSALIRQMDRSSGTLA